MTKVRSGQTPDIRGSERRRGGSQPQFHLSASRGRGRGRVGPHIGYMVTLKTAAMLKQISQTSERMGLGSAGSVYRTAGLVFVFLWFFLGGIAHFAAASLEMSIVP